MCLKISFLVSFVTCFSTLMGSSSNISYVEILLFYIIRFVIGFGSCGINVD
jgi:hypothetical protein